jgi:hypothetical protein
VTHISPFDARCLLRDRPARPAMPLTTATLNCTVESANSAAFLVEPTPSTGRPLLAPRSAASPSSAPSLDQLITTAIARPSAHSRRLTLARFPLLRKGSRELTRSPSLKLAPQTAVHSPFLALGAPRASSSIARGPESLPTREPVNDDSETDVIAVEHTRAADPSRVEKPDKMHQTSSRLLRMTDDERPFTRVRSTFPGSLLLHVELATVAGVVSTPPKGHPTEKHRFDVFIIGPWRTLRSVSASNCLWM